VPPAVWRLTSSYDVRNLAEQFNAKPNRIKRFPSDVPLAARAKGRQWVVSTTQFAGGAERTLASG
jgi:hypothetical protein